MTARPAPISSLLAAVLLTVFTVACSNYYEIPIETPMGMYRFVVTANRYRVESAPFYIEGAQTLTVAMHTGERYGARLVHASDANDLALIKVDGQSGLPVAPVGDSSSGWEMTLWRTAASFGSPDRLPDPSGRVARIAAMAASPL